MPKELPSAADLWEGAITFFSIDTDLIQSAGYDFSAGELNQLPAQLPAKMKLQLTEIVAQEIIKHRMEPVLKSIAQFKASSDALKRTAGLDMANIDGDFENLNAEIFATARFRHLIEDYVSRCRGQILPIDGAGLAAQVFAYYFAGKPPFAQRADKKSEFPDATTLILLEMFAKENQTKGIFASRDSGSSEFAAQSEYLYCVKSIDELATLFAATDEISQAIKSRVLEAISVEPSVVLNQLHSAIEDHVAEAQWNIGDIYSGTVARVEGHVSEVRLNRYTVHRDNAEIWAADDEAGAWIVELGASVEVVVIVSITFFVWDSIDREEIELDTQQFEFPSNVEVQAFLNCSGINKENAPEEWEVDVDISSGEYDVDVGEIDPEFDEDYI